MNPGELSTYLDGVVRNRLRMSVMIWGPPGVGKSAIVEQVSTKNYLGFIDIRLSQLTPTDLRGMPIADHHDAMSRFYPPAFLPRKGGGILFLDELNMATPALQGVAQQLILDRKIGDYLVPEGWYIWAAGNRKEDRAAVYDLTGPVTNRFIHVDIRPDIDAFLTYAVGQGIHPHIATFLRERPQYLHRFETHSPAWPSPRTWMMADQLYKSGLGIHAAVGFEAYEEFMAFSKGGEQLPDLDAIIMGQGDGERFPGDQATCEAAVNGLLTRSSDAARCYNSVRWLMRRSSPEWVNEYVEELFRRVRLNGHEENFRHMVAQDRNMQDYLKANAKRFPQDGQIRTLFGKSRVLR
jgi:hypothetical protein